MAAMGGNRTLVAYPPGVFRLWLFLVALGVLVWPPLVWAAYELTKQEHSPVVLDYAALVVGVMPGIIVLWRLLPTRWSIKLGIALLYLLLAFALAMIISLRVVCVRFGNCV